MGQGQSTHQPYSAGDGQATVFVGTVPDLWEWGDIVSASQGGVRNDELAIRYHCTVEDIERIIRIKTSGLSTTGSTVKEKKSAILTSVPISQGFPQCQNDLGKTS